MKLRDDEYIAEAAADALKQPSKLITVEER